MRWFPVNHTWELDLTFLVSEQRRTFAMLGIIDHGSRRLLCLKQLPRKCTLTLLGHLLLTMARHGVPAVILTDNESMFVSLMWRTVLEALGGCHRRSRPGCPWQNGRIERLFGTLKPLLKSIKPNTTEALRKALAEFSWFYNHVRLHQNLKGLTPTEAWNGTTLADVQQAMPKACDGCRHSMGGSRAITFDVGDEDTKGKRPTNQSASSGGRSQLDPVARTAH